MIGYDNQDLDTFISFAIDYMENFSLSLAMFDAISDLMTV